MINPFCAEFLQLAGGRSYAGSNEADLLEAQSRRSIILCAHHQYLRDSFILPICHLHLKVAFHVNLYASC